MSNLAFIFSCAVNFLLIEFFKSIAGGWNLQLLCMYFPAAILSFVIIYKIDKK